MTGTLSGRPRAMRALLTSGSNWCIDAPACSATLNRTLWDSVHTVMVAGSECSHAPPGLAPRALLNESRSPRANQEPQAEVLRR